MAMQDFDLETGKKQIYELMCNELYVPMKRKELAALLQVPRERRDDLQQVLDALLLEGKIQVSGHGKYSKTEGDVIVGTFSGINHTMMIISISACMAGAVCGDHCSPISDTTIMASAGAQCNHMNHVSTQLPYVMVVAVISCMTYILAGFIQSPVIPLIIGIVLMIGTLIGIKYITGVNSKKKEM